MDRLDEFNGIIDKIKSEKREIEGNEPLLRNRTQFKATANPEKTEEAPGIFNFSKTFLSECSLINSTLIQLSDKLKKISQKSDQITFSVSSPTSSKPVDNCKEIEEALNICSMNISIMQKKLADSILNEQKRLLGKGRKETYSSVGSLFTSWFKGPSEDTAESSHHPVFEHLRLVLSFLKIRVGRITEEMEAYKTRRRNRELLMNQSSNRTTLKPAVPSRNPLNPVNTGASSADDQVMTMLQVENTRMIEEMSRGLFETLNTTESQVLEISRLQATLQSHLTVQHDLTCRLFEDSVATVNDTKKGNEYLKKNGKDGSLMRTFLVSLILGMSLLLLLLHYFNK